MTEPTPDPCETCGSCFGCAMTDADKALIAQTDWPTTGPEATADALIRHGARLAIAISADNHELMKKAFALDKESPDRKPALAAYMDSIVSMISHAQVVDMLVMVQSRSREQADQIAHRLWDLAEDGGVIQELMWDYLDARGVNADAVFEMAEREARARHTDRHVWE